MDGAEAYDDGDGSGAVAKSVHSSEERAILGSCCCC